MTATSGPPPARKPALSRVCAVALAASAASRLPARDKLSLAHPDFRVMASGIEIGAGWTNVSQVRGHDCVSLTLSHPDIGPRAYKVNLAPSSQRDDVFALIWNPGTDQPPPRRPCVGRPPIRRA